MDTPQEPNDSQEPRRKRKGPKKAKEKLMDYLARRDHSELELRTKIQNTGKYSPQEIEAGIAWIKEQNWLPDPVDLAERTARQLHEKPKGYLYIYNYLKRKGLPPVDRDPGLEMDKARQFAQSRYGDQISGDNMEKLIRQLRSRGFEEETLRKVYYEKR